MSRVSRAVALLRRAAASARTVRHEPPTLDRVASLTNAARACSPSLAACRTTSSTDSVDVPCSSSSTSFAFLRSRRQKSTRAGSFAGDKSGPRSLEIEEGESVSGADGATHKPPAQPNMFIRLALSFGGFYSKESTNQRAADRLYNAVNKQCDSDIFHQTFGIEKSFRGEHAVLVLHVWLLLKRIRSEGEKGKGVAQVVYDTFQDEVEHRVHAEGVRVRVSKLLNELEQGFYGSALAYDNALTGASGDLAKVLYRNVYHNEGDEKFSKQLERYVRRELGCLTQTSPEAVLEGRLAFSRVEGDREL